MAIDFNTPSLRRYRVWRYTKDRIATVSIATGGISVIGAILLIFLYLMYEIQPMFNGAEIDKKAAYSFVDTTPSLYLAMEEQAEIGLHIGQNAQARFFDTRNGETVADYWLPIQEDERLNNLAIDTEENHQFMVTDSAGHGYFVKHSYQVTYPNDVRVITPRLEFPYGEEGFALLENGESERLLAVRDAEEALLVALVDDDERLVLWQFAKEEDMLEETVTLEPQQIEVAQVDHIITHMAFDTDGRWLFAVTESGNLIAFNLAGIDSGSVTEKVMAKLPGPVADMRMLLGGISVMLGFADGKISQWFMLREETGEWRIVEVRDFADAGENLQQLSMEQRRKGFVSVTRDGLFSIFHSTSERLLLQQRISDSPVNRVVLSPRADALLLETADGQIAFFDVHNEHPEISWSSLWGEVWYESYQEPEYVWQSSASNNDFEPKYSLMPLSFGTLKAAFYAMLLGAPLAICGAIYTAYFMTPALRRKIKPLVELMEALPTVILGFLAGLWLAPFMEHNLAAIFMLLIVTPLGILLASYLFTKLPASWRHALPDGWEGGFLIPVVILLGWFCIATNGIVEQAFFGGDARAWLTNDLGISFDQRNALVVGIAMGFAVVPTIFSIAEDAIFSVPKSLTYGSLALGATRWQTLMGVILPTASPGIFSALMIGMGRAVGETMIVLMATGNTPVMDINIFEGMRTLAANIAVEVPEAEVDSSHYRVLFLAAFVLFMFTFIVNTLAEMVRQNLRKKYGSL